MIYGLLLVLLAACGLVLSPWGRRPSELAPFDRDRTLPLRGLLALLVVIGHCDLKMPGSPLLKALHMATPAVSVFFFLSGYGLVRSVLRNRDGYLKGFLPRSFIKIGIPLAAATIAACLFLKFRGEAVGLPHRGYELLTRGRNFPYHSWYVYVLLAHYVAFAIAFARGPFRRGLLLFAGFSLGLYLFLRFGLRWPSVWWRTSLAMTLGALWAYHEERIRSAVLRWNWRVYGIASVVVLFCLAVQNVPESTLPRVKDLRVHSVLVVGPATVLIMYVLHGLPRLVTGSFAFLGVISYEIYLLHFVGERGLVSLFASPIPYCLAAVLVAVLLAYPVHRLDTSVVRYLSRLLVRRERE